MPLKKILLVDDDVAINFLNRMVIEESEIKCAVEDVIDGQQALNYIQSSEECPDVIFLDINMPGMDGFQFLEKFENGHKCCDRSKVYMLTSSIRDEDRELALSYKSVAGFFGKPLSNEWLDEILAGGLSARVNRSF